MMGSTSNHENKENVKFNTNSYDTAVKNSLKHQIINVGFTNLFLGRTIQTTQPSLNIYDTLRRSI